MRCVARCNLYCQSGFVVIEIQLAAGSRLKMGGVWSFLSTSKNQKTLSWISGGLVVVAGGAWAVFTYLWPHDASSPGVAKIVCAQPGGVAAGRDASGNTITINGAVQVAMGTKPCVEAGKPQ
jgi:hypothetical protein